MMNQLPMFKPILGLIQAGKIDTSTWRMSVSSWSEFTFPTGGQVFERTATRLVESVTRILTAWTSKDLLEFSRKGVNAHTMPILYFTENLI